MLNLEDPDLLLMRSMTNAEISDVYTVKELNRVIKDNDIKKSGTKEAELIQSIREAITNV